MTLCLAGLNRRNVVVAADRRLTSEGNVYRGDRIKLTLVETGDSRGVIAFAGLAEAGSFRTDVWLLETLLAAAPPQYTLGAVIEGLRVKAGETINGLRLDANQRRLSFYFAGFGYPDGDAGDPRVAYCFVSNFERAGERLAVGSWEEFEVTGSMEIARASRTGGDDASAVVIGGNYPVVARADVEGLQTLLERDAPAHALVGKAVDVIRETARRPESGGTIGEDLLTAVVPSDVSVGPDLAHRPIGPVSYVTAANYARLRGEGDSLLTREAEFGPVAPGDFVPEVGRNERCPCGSGLKYKRCHGR